MEYQAETPPPPSSSSNKFVRSAGSLISLSASSRRTAGRKKKDDAQEAVLLSQATSQAMIAARSILLSGGSQATALSTAKAAAQSILVPDYTDAETGVANGKSFLGRRKGKRQAEIVASMALLSVNNSIQGMDHQSGSQWDAAGMLANSQGMPPSYIGPPSDAPSSKTASLTFSSEERYKNCATPAVPTIKPPSLMSRQSSSGKEFWSKRDNYKHNDENSSYTEPRRRGSSLRLPETMPAPRSRAKDVTPRKSGEDPIYYTSTSRASESRPTIHTSYTSGEEDDDEDGDEEESMFESTIDDSTLYDSTIGDTIGTSTVLQHNASKQITTNKDRGFLQTSVDPFLFGLTSAFGCSLSPTNPSPLPSPKKKGRSRQHRRTSTLENVLEEETTQEGSYFESRDERQTSNRSFSKLKREKPIKKRSSVLKGIEYRHSRGDSQSSADSSQILRELNVSSSGEDDAQQRERPSSIRESMQQVVLRALSVGGTERNGIDEAAETANNLNKDAITESRLDRRNEIFTGVYNNHSNNEGRTPASSSAKTSARTPTLMLSKRPRFRNWVRSRKAKSTPNTPVSF